MSGIAGVWCIGPGPGPEGVLEALGSGLWRRGSEPPRCRADGRVGMVHRALAPPGSDPGRRQPFRFPDGVLLAWDGRLDNGGDLAARLGPTGCGPGGVPSDLGLVAEAYRRWGAAGVERLVGDFAFSLWDPGRRHLLLARDAMGCRPLFYVREPGRLLWASTLEALLSVGVSAGEVDEEWVAGFLTVHRDPERTPFRHVRTLPAGTVAIASPGGVQIAPYWRPVPPRDVHFRDDREYEESYAELFREAVGCRLRDRAPVGAELSGGLDSSAVVCVGEELVRHGKVGCTEILPVSFVYGRSATADEQTYIRAVERRIGRASHRLTEEDHPHFDRLEEPFFELPSGMVASTARIRAQLEYLRGRGSATLLSGIGGDPLLWSEVPAPVQLADELLRRGVGAAWKAAVAWSKLDGRPVLKLIREGILEPLAPPGLRAWTSAPFPVPSWVDRTFARRLDLHGRYRKLASSFDRRGLRPTQREHVRVMAATIDAISWRFDYGPIPVDLAYPYLDRRLVEFCLGLPFDQMVRGRETRSVHRRALRGVLPERIRTRTTKATMAEALFRGLADRWPVVQGLFDDPRICAYGFADRRELESRLLAARFARTLGTEGLLQALGLELWLRRLERAGPADSLRPVGHTGIVASSDQLV